MYVTSNGHCVEMKIPEQQKDTMDHLILPEDAKLLQSGNIADSNLRVNLYGGVIEKEGHQGILSHSILYTTVVLERKTVTMFKPFIRKFDENI